MTRLYLYYLTGKIWIVTFLAFMLNITYLMGLITHKDFLKCAPKLFLKSEEYKGILQGIILSRAFGW